IRGRVGANVRFPIAAGFSPRADLFLGRRGPTATTRARRANEPSAPKDEDKMTFTDAAAEVLRLVGKPLHYKEITDIAIEKNLLSHVGKSPEVTMGARLAATLKKDTAENPLVRVKPGVFALREWDDKTIKAGMEPKKGARKGQRPEASPSKPSRADAPEAAEAEDDDEVLIG